MSVGQALAKGFREFEIDGVVWRLRLMDPVIAAEAGLLLGMVATLARPDTHKGPPDERRAAEIQFKVLRACVVGAKELGAEAWEKIEIVADPEQEDQLAGKLSFSSLCASLTTVTSKGGRPVCLAAVLFSRVIIHWEEARQALAPFRPAAAAAGAPASDGEAVRPASVGAGEPPAV